MGPRTPPRLAVRTLVATSGAIGIVLVAVFVVLSMDAQRRIRATAFDTLDASQRSFGEFEQIRQQDTLVTLNALVGESRVHGRRQCLSRLGGVDERDGPAA